jgi:SAM-dependent methyltransferase
LEQIKVFDGPVRLLHVAPEKIFEAKLRKIDNIDYVTGDLFDPRAKVEMDITDIQFPDNSFDLILCSHVLEHVQDDRKAMRELERVLAPGGRALLMIPLTTSETFEDPSVTSPRERRRLFGQEDHVRSYGPDVKDRFAEAGFEVAALAAPAVLDEPDLRLMSVPETEVLFSCTKPNPQL